MSIEDLWDRLDPATQQWFVDNPGCQILPRTITSIISKEASEEMGDGQHGEKVLSHEDHEFIRTKAN